ncbi:ATP-dependent DNA helicase [Leeia sp. TBRC 13508]|uniref:DNA 5'-3' helicase n=1 Tax=Leeia speluncae TaxID=2884804 RepID=A0ABS8D8G6_9NEIS|nr:ATP-dependent DNA helicase [Leeia speluncae]MCB6184476.1 ATP-dependent DNA helicase [Leeia speluncae]
MTLEKVFAEDGPLATAMPGFRVRPQQLEMAVSIESAIKENKCLVAEAGTGTGKTMAYLVPALRSGGKVLISTGTKNLQDQLYFRDLPAVRNALKAPVKIALLKGRSNYVCHHHLQRVAQDGRFASKEDAAQLPKIIRFAEKSITGDKSELGSVPETANVWSMVTSTRDNCLGQECDDYENCFVIRARREAMQADVVVVNHHLFFADVALKDEGVAELLPACNTIIFDEAHQLPDVASLFFGDTIAISQLIDLARDTRLEAMLHVRDFSALPEAAQSFEKQVRDWRLTFKQDVARFAYAEVEKNTAFLELTSLVADSLKSLREILETQQERAEEIKRCAERAAELHVLLDAWANSEESQLIRWLELTPTGMQLHSTPLSIAQQFSRQVKSGVRSWIFASATISVGGDFSHYCNEMGLYEAECKAWDSPFDYPNQALLYAPQNMPDPNSPAYTRSVVDAAFPLIKAGQGGAFLLFTSLRAMREAYELLTIRLASAGLEFPVLLQGEASRTELLDRFRQTPNAILVASQSFWEGVDVPGDALRFVLIDRLPFASPDDPVLAARIEHLQKKGVSPFVSLQLPHAVITLKQGAGRLIRTETDKGVLMICDPRLVDKPYGKRIWRSLPPMRRTREVLTASEFLAENVPGKKN